MQQRKEKEQQRPAGAAATVTTKAAGTKPEPCKQSIGDVPAAATGTGGGSTQMQSNIAGTIGQRPGHNHQPVNCSPKANPAAEQPDRSSPCNCGKRKKHESNCGSKPAATAGNAAAKGKAAVGEESSTTKPRKLVFDSKSNARKGRVTRKQAAQKRAPTRQKRQTQVKQAFASVMDDGVMCPSYPGDPCRQHSMKGVREKKGRRNVKGVEQLRWCCYSCKVKGRKRPDTPSLMSSPSPEVRRSPWSKSTPAVKKEPLTPPPSDKLVRRSS